MKNITGIIIIILFPLFHQIIQGQEHMYVIKKQIEYSSTGQVKQSTLNTYNTRGNVIRTEYYNEKNALKGYATFDYNENDQVTTYHYHPPSGKRESSEINTYNPKGLLIKKSYYSADSPKKPLYYDRYKYDSHGSLKTIERYDGPLPISDTYTTYTYNKKKQLIKEKEYKWPRILLSTCEYTYRADKLETASFTPGNHVKGSSSTSFYEYDEAGRLHTITISARMSEKFVMDYDQNNNLIKKSCYYREYINGKKQEGLSYYIEYEYILIEE